MGALLGSLEMSRDQPALLDGRFAKLLAASTVSALGSGLATVAAPLFVTSRTKDPLVVSAAFAIAWLPWLLFALPGGVLVDRVDRRRLMDMVDWIRVVAMSVRPARPARAGHGPGLSRAGRPRLPRRPGGPGRGRWPARGLVTACRVMSISGAARSSSLRED